MGDSFHLAALALLAQLRELIMCYNTPTHPLSPCNVAALQRLGQLHQLCFFALPPDANKVSCGVQHYPPDNVTNADFSSLAVALPHLVHLSIDVGTQAANCMMGAALQSLGEHCCYLTGLDFNGEWDMTCWSESAKTQLFPRLQSLTLHDLIDRGVLD
jgi:hypothetical protein